jgi:hypothetical protein
VLENINENGLTTYTDTLNHFTLKYPANWSIKQIQTDLVALNSEEHLNTDADLMTIEVYQDTYASYLTSAPTERKVSSRETIRNEEKTGTLEKGEVTNLGSEVETFPYVQYVLPLGDDETLIFFLHDDSQENVNIMLSMVKSLEFIDHQTDRNTAYYSLLRYKTASSCFNFIQQHSYLDPSLVMGIQDTTTLQSLAADWQWGYICESSDNSGIFVIALNKHIESDQSKSEVINNTLKIYPSAKELIALDAGYSDYQFYYLVSNKSEISFDSTNRVFESGDLVPITELAWSEALASCNIEPGNFIADQGVIISCGSGDNGCVNAERVKWNLLTGEHTYISNCSNNCDLLEDEPYVFDCKL